MKFAVPALGLSPSISARGKILPALALVVFLASPIALAFAGHREITADDVSQFKVGVTTYSDVAARLGKPSSVSVMSNGTRIVAYVGFKSHVKAATFIPIVGLFAGGATGDTSVATFAFGPDGVLQSSSATNAQVDCSVGIISAGCQGGGAVPPPALPPSAPTGTPPAAPIPRTPTPSPLPPHGP
jgi:hypothetical protein